MLRISVKMNGDRVQFQLLGRSTGFVPHIIIEEKRTRYIQVLCTQDAFNASTLVRTLMSIL